MGSLSSNNIRIAKNTVMLYIRMLFVLFVSLYTVRVVLNALGAEEYGLYNVVGGVVVLFSFLTNTLATASQRYFAYEIGRNDDKRLNLLFSLTFVLYISFAIIILVLAETLGLWFVVSQMTIPSGSMREAVIIYQFSVVSFIFSILTTPFQALIIAREKMGIYAIIGIIEAVLKLLVALTFVYLPINKLVAYGFLFLLSHLITNSVYIFYCRYKYLSSRIYFYWNKALAKEIIFYSGWNMYGGFANVLKSHGINILINIFFNTTVNAARGIAFQINNAVNSFSSNFYTAVRPQITKNYAMGERQSTLSLVFMSSKLSYFMLMALSIPVLILKNELLTWWLGDVPNYTEIFVFLVIINSLIDSLSNPLMTLVQATGRVKLYQCIVGTLILLNLPISYIFLFIGYEPEITMYVSIMISVLLLIVRILVLRYLVSFPIKDYCLKIIVKVICTSVLAFFLCSILYNNITLDANSVVSLISNLFIHIIVTMSVIVLVGLSRNEIKSLISLLKR